MANDNDINSGVIPSAWKFWKHKRFIVSFLLFVGTLNVHVLRVNMSVSVVAMTQDRVVEHENGTITQVYGLSIGSTAVLTLLTPWATYAGIPYLIVLRALTGVCESGYFPSFYAVISRWAPAHERSRLNSLSLSGIQIGTVIAMPLCAILADRFGWESIFYATGIFGIVCASAILIFVAEEPAKDKYISEWEIKYIQSSMQNISFEKLKIPWKSLLTSSTVLALCAAHFAENWGYYTFLTQLPMYLHDALKFDLVNAGFLSGAPYLAMAILLVGSGSVVDVILKKGWIGATNLRKILTCLSFLSQSLFLFIIPKFDDAFTIVAMIIASVAIGALAWSGFGVSFHDIAPQYSSVIIAVSNTCAALPGIVSPLLGAYFVQNKTVEEWQNVFYVASGIFLWAAIVYGIWGKSELQTWATQTNKCDIATANNTKVIIDPEVVTP